jgi:Xaa-Pro dipeptidase
MSDQVQQDDSVWETIRRNIDDMPTFESMRGTPYYQDSVYHQFSPQEYERRRAALRHKMRELNVDCAILPGGPSHWSFGGGMRWLSGHREWQASAVYVVLPLEGEPTLVYGMGGTHIEAVRRETSAALTDVRSSRLGHAAEVIAERIRELGLASGRIALLELDPRQGDHLPVNQYFALQRELPDAELVFTEGILHELMSVKSDEELAAFRRSGELCQAAMEAVAERARPGVTENQLAAAAAGAIIDGGGEVDFIILGSTPMDEPALVFGNPRPSERQLRQGDILNMEIAAGYQGYAAQIGSPITLGPPTDDVKRFWDQIVLPGYEMMVKAVRPGGHVREIQELGRFFREQGCQSRPMYAHGLDFVSDQPHVFTGKVDAEPFDEIFRPGNVFMVEPTPITADGSFGIFLGHSFIVTDTGNEVVDQWPLEIVVANG